MYGGNMWDAWTSPLKDDKGLFRGGDEERNFGRFRDAWENKPLFGETGPSGFPIMDLFMTKIRSLFTDLI